MSTIAERVARGAEFLDEHDPDWWRADVPNAIDLGTLDLSNGDECVLGQRCPLEQKEMSTGYNVQIRKLSGAGQGVLEDVLDTWADDLGFTIRAERGHWGALTAAWRELIEARRSA
jgi:hypothetical protein